jgi:hypothetical protein
MSLRKFSYYSQHSVLRLVPPAIHRWYVEQQTTRLDFYSERMLKEIEARVNYYCQLSTLFSPNHSSTTSVQNFKKTGGNTYYFDLRKVIKGFHPQVAFSFINGDVRDVPESPCFVKSRPCQTNNDNSVLLKLNAIRHFRWVKDTTPFTAKKNQLVWKGAGYRENRLKFVDLFHDHPQCDVSRTDIKRMSQKSNRATFGSYMSPEEQLKSKFIVSLEGKDVASNLKWIMASNSACIMPKPKFETWFMEGKLQAGVHYIDIKDDYSDLLEKLDYYLTHADETKHIIHNAHQWVSQFMDLRREYLIQLLVAHKYFSFSKQAQLFEYHPLKQYLQPSLFL